MLVFKIEIKVVYFSGTTVAPCGNTTLSQPRKFFHGQDPYTLCTFDTVTPQMPVSFSLYCPLRH